MILRKLVQSGPSSFTIALPIKWVQSHKLTKGDVLSVEAFPEKLVVVPSDLKRKKAKDVEIIVSVDDKVFREVQRDVRSAYLSANTIILEGKEIPEKLELIKREVSELVGLEIIDESRVRIVCKNFANIEDIDVENILRRIDNIVRSMLLDMPFCIEKPELATGIKERDFSVNKLGYLILKCMKNALEDHSLLDKLKITPLKILLFWDINVHVEKIGDEAKRIARLLAQLKNKKINKQGIISICKSATDSYVDVMKCFYTNDLKLSDEVSMRREKIVKDCDDYFEKHKDVIISEVTGKIKGMLSHISDISRLVRYLAVNKT